MDIPLLLRWEYDGLVSLEDSLVRSLNAPFIRLWLMLVLVGLQAWFKGWGDAF